MVESIGEILQFCYAEIEHFDQFAFAVALEKDILGLQVAMHYAATMGHLHGGADLFHYGEYLWQWDIRLFVQLLSQSHPLEIFHYQIDKIRLGDTEIHHSYRVGM